MTTTLEKYRPRVWAGCLESYNNGDLVGEWVTIAEGMTADQLQAKIQTVIEGEEWGFFDFADIGEITEYQDLEYLVKAASGIYEHGDSFIAWLAIAKEMDDDPIEGYDSRFMGSAETLEAYADECLLEPIREDLSKIMVPGLGQKIGADTFFDIASLVNSLECCGHYRFVRHKHMVYIFST